MGNRDTSTARLHYKATASISPLFANRTKNPVANLSRLVTKPVSDFYDHNGTSPSQKQKSTISPNAQEFKPSTAPNKPKQTFSRVAGYTPLFDGKPSDSGRFSELNGELYASKIHGKSNLSLSQK
jgi:hypothetical protein